MLSIVIPTIRPQNLPQLFSSIQDSCGKYPFEVIFVGPYNLPESLCKFKNIKYLRDFGSPIRCIQLGTTLAEEPLLCHGADDGFYYPRALESAIDQYSSICKENDAIGLKYSEDGLQRDDIYWTCEYHDDLRLPSIRHLKFSPLTLINTKEFQRLGGYNCIDYTCANMPCIAFSLKLQLNGGHLYLSNDYILNVRWLRGETGDHKPIHDKELGQDIPGFKQEFATVNLQYPSYDNWKLSNKIWDRFNVES